MAASFGGGTARRVIAEARNISRLEHEADKLQDQCAKVAFDAANELSPASLFMWSKVVKKIGNIANHAENVGDQFRLFVAAWAPSLRSRLRLSLLNAGAGSGLLDSYDT